MLVPTSRRQTPSQTIGGQKFRQICFPFVHSSAAILPRSRCAGSILPVPRAPPSLCRGASSGGTKAVPPLFSYDPGLERSSFLKKRTKKLLCFMLRAVEMSATANQKFFASFFQKRRPFLLAFS
jgi:hypothetical protein